MIVLNLLTEKSRWVPLLHLKRSEGPLNVLNRGLSRTYICFFKISISIALYINGKFNIKFMLTDCMIPQ